MKKYAVAIASDAKGTNEITVIEADNEVNALILALEETLELEFVLPDTVEELIAYYAENEMMVSAPIEI